MNRFTEIAPVSFALVGAGVGICAGMLMHNTPPYEVRLEVSVPLATVGVLVGLIVGFSLMGASDRRPRLADRVGLVSAGLLGAAMMAPLGWIAGTEIVTRDRRHVNLEDVKHLPSVGMAVGAVIGCAVGLAHVGIQMRLDRRRRGARPPAAVGPSRMSPHGDV